MKNAIYRILTLAVLCLCPVMPLVAQRFTNVTLDGAQMVCSIAQDSTGMMWIGTESGLYSYDGYHNYRHYRQGHLSQTHVYALYIDHGIIYMATGNGLLRYDIRRRTYLTPSEGRTRSAEMRAINAKAPVTAYTADVYSLLPTQRGLLIGTTRGLFLENGGRRTPLTVKSGQQPLINAMMPDNDGKHHRGYWIGTEGALYHADPALRSFTTIDALSGNSVKCLTQTPDGTLYIGTDNGLYALRRDGNVQHVIHDSRNAFSLPNNIVWSCFVDRWQNVWTGTDNGLAYLSTRPYETWTSLGEITGSGEGNFLHELLQARDGSWWMGGTNGLIHCRRTPTGYADVVWYKQNAPSHPLAHNRVRKIYEDREGDIWVATDHGINLVDRVTRQMHNIVITDATGKYSSAWAYDIVEDLQGRMWVAAYDGGIFIIAKNRLVASGATCIADRHLSDARGGLSGLHVGQLALATDGHIWASTYNGLDRIDPATLRVTNRMKGESINFLLADKRGAIWTGGNGTVKRYTATGQPTTWNVGGNVTTLCAVGDRIWAISGSVCSVIDTQRSGIRFGIPYLVPQTLFYSEKEQHVVMGGNDGIVSINAAIARAKVTPQRLLLTGITVGGHLRADSLFAPADLKALTLQHDENSFTLHLSDFPFADNPSAVYAYRLEGVDSEWRSMTDDAPDITYNGLPYGDYHLTVHRVEATGNVGAEVYALDIRICPPWYLSAWAKVLYCLVALGLLLWATNFYLVRKRLAEERRQKEAIIAQTEARVHFFDRLSQELKQPLARLMNTLFAFHATTGAPASKEQQTLRRASSEISDLVLRALDMGSNAEALQQPPTFADVDIVELCKIIAAPYPACRVQSESSHLMLPVDVVRWHAMTVIILRFMLRRNTQTGARVTLTLRQQKDTAEAALLFEGDAPLVEDNSYSDFYQLYYDPADALYMAKDYAALHHGTIALGSDAKSIRLTFPAQGTQDDTPGTTHNAQPTTTTPQADENFLTQINQIIEKNMADADFNVATLQEKTAMGNKQLYRKLKALTGLTPVEYIRDSRMRKAAMLLGQGKFTVSEVMYTVGFTSSSYFSKCFQKAFGMTPTEYIKREISHHNTIA